MLCFKSPSYASIIESVSLNLGLHFRIRPSFVSFYATIQGDIDLAIIQSLCHEPRYTCSLCEHTSFSFVIVCLLTLSPPSICSTHSLTTIRYHLGSLAGEFLCYDSWHSDLAIIQSLCHEPRYTCSLCEHTSFIFVFVCLLTLSPPSIFSTHSCIVMF